MPLKKAKKVRWVLQLFCPAIQLTTEAGQMCCNEWQKGRQAKGA
jgi:hypothetical protein